MHESLLSKLTRKQIVLDVVKEASKENGLKKVLGVRDLISFGISSTLGSGIFVTIGAIAAFAGPGLCLSFLLAACGSLLSAACYAEFASRLPVSGQSYTYSYVALGELAAFITGWLGFLSYSVATAAVSRGWATYLDSFLRASLHVHLPRWLVDDPINDLFSLSGLAALLNVVCTVLACYGVHESTKVSFILVVINFSLMTLFSVYGAYQYGDMANLEHLLPFGWTGVVKGSGLAFFCCIGWELICTLSEEVRRPSRDLPKGIIGSIGAVVVLYCAVCITLSCMVPFELISLKAPIADAFRFHHDKVGALVVSFTVVIACIPSTLSGIVGTPRILYKMAKDGLMYSWLSRVNSHGSPSNAAIVCGILSAVLAGGLHFESLASSCSAVTLFLFVMVCVGVIIVRVSEHESPVHPHAIKRLTVSLIAFCVISLLLSVCLVENGIVSNPTLLFLISLNVLCGAWVRYAYRWALDTNFLSHPLLTSEIAFTTVEPRAKRDVYLCPLVPTIPLLAAWVDIFMMASVGFNALGGLLVLLFAGLLIYFSYGIQHSKLTKR